MDFTSDNAAGVAPEVMAALAAANDGMAKAYGEDEISERVHQRLSDLFEREVTAFLVATGTAANALSLATLIPPYGTIYAHEEAHIHVDECAAPEFYAGGAKIIPLPGFGGKIDSEALEMAIEKFPRGVVHRPQPGALSLTQATEFGCVYTPDEVRRLTGMAHGAGIPVHMDGARFANAMVTLGLSPAEATWKLGVDVLVFGATKNGGMAAEAVVFFDPDKAADFHFRQKRAGHIFSKGRYLAAQIDAMLEDDLWLRLARSANDKALALVSGMEAEGLGAPVYPVDANEIFIALPLDAIRELRKKGTRFHEWPVPPGNGRQLIRLVTSFATPNEAVDGFLAALKGL